MKIKSKEQTSQSNEGNSKYAKKIALQKQGIFSTNSPFSCGDYTTGIPLKKFNKRRFKH